jgi:hypothetical protein
MKPIYAILILLFAAACSKHEPAALPPPPPTGQKPPIFTNGNVTEDAAIETPPDTTIIYTGKLDGHSYCGSFAWGIPSITVVISWRERAIFFADNGMEGVGSNKYPLKTSGIYQGIRGKIYFTYQMVGDSLYLSAGEANECDGWAKFSGKRK